jgi:hypothetical protein
MRKYTEEGAIWAGASVGNIYLLIAQSQSLVFTHFLPHVAIVCEINIKIICGY